MPVSMPVQAPARAALAESSSFNPTLQEVTMPRIIVAILTAALCTLFTPNAKADTRVSVHDFYGPNADKVRDDVVNLLERQSGVTIISRSQIENAAEKLGVDPFSPAGRIALGRELQLSAWMTGVVKKHSGKLKLTVVVYDGTQHVLVGRTRLSGSTTSKLAYAINRSLWRKSRYAIMRASAAGGAVPLNAKAIAETTPAEALEPAATPAAAGESAAVETASADGMEITPAEAEAPAAAETASASSEVASTGAERRDTYDESIDEGPEPRKKGESFRASLGFGSPYRNLAYSSPITSSLGNYQMSGAPMLDLNLVFFPARPFTDGVASWFGLDVRGQVAFSTPTVDRDGNKFKSSYDAYHVGLRARVPVASHSISAFSGYAMNRFEVTSTNKEVRAPTPSTDYRMIRTGAGAEFALTDTFLLGAEASILQFLSVGDIGRWFPRASAGGFEVAAAATYSLTQGIFARAAASYQRTSFDLNPRPGDQYAARGAIDQYLALSVGAGLRL
jgi:hypothetical protein